MTLKQAKEKYNKATKVVCLVRKEETLVIPGTVKRGWLTPKCYFMENSLGSFTMVVDTYEQIEAKIIE